MLLPGETDEEVLSDAGLRRLISPLVPSFDDLNILRAHVYRHQARQAERFVRGRIALVGDAAHLMPPWAGQGLNSGIRDATNLAWKLAAIERGVSTSTLLETYHAERHQHARQAIKLSRRFGKVFIPRDRKITAARDVLLGGLKHLPVLRDRFYQKWFTTPLRYSTGAFVHRTGGIQHPFVGGMFIQPEVVDATGLCRLDDVLGPWFALVSYRCEPLESLSEQAKAFWKNLDARLVRVGLSRATLVQQPASTVVVEDTYGSLEQWFRKAGAQIAVIRPDRVVAAVASTADFEAVSAELASQLDRTGAMSRSEGAVTATSSSEGRGAAC